MLVKDLLDEIPADTMEVVARACDGWNLRVRRQLTDQFLRFGLQYRRGDRNLNASISPQWDRVGMPIRFQLPEKLGERAIPKGFDLAARLSVYAPSARALGTSATQLLRLFEPRREAIWKGTPISPGMARGTLHGAQSLSEELLRLATPLIEESGSDHFDLVRFLLEVDQDILGSYQYDARESGTDSNPSGGINVYWGVVGLVASALGIGTGPLAVVVLTHELAHGYSHLGHDRDGQRWAGKDFKATEHPLKEAIAQYYTHLVAEALDGALPGVLDAYERLLPHQPPAYHVHLPWLLHCSPERVASALAELRRGRGTLAAMNGLLKLKDEMLAFQPVEALEDLRRRRLGAP